MCIQVIFILFWDRGFPSDSAVKESACNAGDQEMWVQSLDLEDPLDEEMAAHSSILSCQIPLTEEPGRL